MKISPVQGTPTIPQPSSTGLSPEKLIRLRSIAAGEKPDEPATQATIATQENPKPIPTEKTIKMNVNRTPDLIDALQQAPATTESATADTDVQTKPAPEAIQAVSPEVAALAKQRRALQVKERELADKEKAIQGSTQSFAELKTKAQSNALSVLQELGISYDQLTSELLAKQSNGDTEAIEARLKSFEKTIEDKFAEKDTAQEQAVFDHMKKNVDKITFSSEKYKFIRESKSQDEVMELIRREWKENGVVLDEEEAMDTIEATLLEDAKRYAKLLGATEPTTSTPAQTVPQSGIKTLTNKDSARPQMTRRQRAIAAALGQK